MPKFKATFLVLISTENSEKLEHDQQRPYWVQRAQPQPLLAHRAQCHRDQVHGFRSSVEEDEELDSDVPRYRAHAAPAPTTPQTQTIAQSKTVKEGHKKPEQPKGEDNKENS